MLRYVSLWQFFAFGGLVVLLVLGLVCIVFTVGSLFQQPEPPEKLYPMTGVVVEIDPAKQWVTVDHDAIPGLMKAMRMKFAVGEPEVLEGVTVGDELLCSLKVTADGQYVLVQSPC